jgi:hypothetical protein
MASLSEVSGPPYHIEGVEGVHSMKVAHQSISMHPSCRDMSFEELRMQEYSAGRITTKPETTTIPDSSVFKLHPAAAPTHCRKSIRASRDDVRK